MKRIYQILGVVFASAVLMACNDPKKDLQADITAIEQITEKSQDLKAIQDLQAKLPAALESKNTAEVANIFKQIGAAYAKLKDSVSALKLKTDDVKGVQTKFIAGVEKFIQLMNLSAQYSVTPPANEQEQAAFAKLQQEASAGLLDANKALQDAKAKLVAEPAKK